MPRRRKTSNSLNRPIDPYVLYYAWKRANKKQSNENVTPRKKSSKPKALSTPRK
jgi:hypothetical protein